MNCDTDHAIIGAVPTYGYSTYTTSRQSYGFNCTAIFGSTLRYSSGGSAKDGTLPFTSGSNPGNYRFGSNGNLNPAYWNEVKAFVQSAADAGLVVALNPFPGQYYDCNNGGGCGASGSGPAFANNGSAAVTALGAAIGSMFANSPNIMWYIGDDCGQSASPFSGGAIVCNLGLESSFIQGILSTDPNHLVMFEGAYSYSYSNQYASSFAASSGSHWTDLLYSYYETYGVANAAYVSSPASPCFLGETNYEGGNNTGGLSSPANAFIVRMEDWWTMTSGCAGYTWGNESVNHNDSGYPGSLNTTATAEVIQLPKLFNQYKWWNLVPDTNHAVITGGYGNQATFNENLYTASYATTACASDGTFCFTYTPVAHTLSVALSQFPAPVAARWYDPTNGTFTPISSSPFTNSGNTNIGTPGQNHDGNGDWVLVLDATAGGAPLDSTISISSGSGVQGGTVNLTNSLAISGGAVPVGLEWTMAYPVADVASVSISPSASLAATGKSLSCSNSSGSSLCRIYGINTTPIPAGAIANVAFDIAPSAPDTSATIQLLSPIAMLANGTSAPAMEISGTISITKVTSVAGLACLPNTVTGPGSSTCTISLSGPAPSPGFSVIVSSNNSNVGVPGSVQVPTGSSTASFTATVAAVSSPQQATLMASASNASSTFTLNVTPSLWTLTGTISGGSGASVALSGAATATVIADGSGNYAFSNLSNGSYAVTPTKAGFTFNPPRQTVNVNSANLTNVNFTAQAAGWSVSGGISGGGGSTIALSGAGNATATADGSGNYSFPGLANGIYYITPAKNGYIFSPKTQSVTVNSANLTSVNFTAQAVTWSLSGTISGGGATVNLSGTSTATTTADGSGSYSFTGLANGPYTVTPVKNGFTFTPPNQVVTVNSANLTSVNFTAQGVTWNLSGTIGGAGGATVYLSGTYTATTTADGSGNYSFAGLANGPYTVTPVKTGFTFTPPSQTVIVNSANLTSVNFTARAVTWSLSGTISGGSGATVNLSGTSTATTMADGSGNYTFVGLANGPYNVTPVKTGSTFTPRSQNVTINAANLSSVNFTTLSVLTWILSGTITGHSVGATVTLSGPSNAATTADAFGNYVFTGLANGIYTVTPGGPDLVFTPPSQSVTIDGANMPGVNFAGQESPPPASIQVDAQASFDQMSKSPLLTSAVFSTNSGNELLLAFIATDYVGETGGPNTTVASVTGAGITWQLVGRTNLQNGDSEIWRAFSSTPLSNVSVAAKLSQSVVSSITVMSFTGVDPSGLNGSGAIGAIAQRNARSAAPHAGLATSRNNSLVVGVGNDWYGAIPRTPAMGQVLVHQALPNTHGVGTDTFWVQRQSRVTPQSGTWVRISDSAPAYDGYNLTICEILAAPPVR
jgi:hypothetical protein